MAATPTTSQNALAQLAKQRLGQVPAVFRGRSAKQANAAMSGGITAGFPVLTVRGKVWRIKYQGNEFPHLRPDGSPSDEIDVVLIAAAPNLSKVWYETGYVEGSQAPPDCFSVDGKKPEPASPKLQNATCGGCRWNVFGSSRTGTGKGKDCADVKRFAVVPLNDLDNARFGGPMLLRIPPASLVDAKSYADNLEKIDFLFYAVGTKLKFDPLATYPKITFAPVRALTDDEAARVATWQEDEIVERILAAPVDEVQTNGHDTSHTEGAAVPPVPQQPAATATPAAATPVTPKVSDPHAEKRATLRGMGFSEEVINGLCGGPAPAVVEPEPEDPRIGQMRQMGFTDEQIGAALGFVTPLEPDAKAAAPAPAEKPKRGRGRPAKEPAAAAAPVAPAAPAVAPAPVQQAMPFEAAPVQAATNGGTAPASAEPARTAELPAGFDDFLDGLLPVSEQQ